MFAWKDKQTTMERIDSHQKLQIAWKVPESLRLKKTIHYIGKIESKSDQLEKFILLSIW